MLKRCVVGSPPVVATTPPPVDAATTPPPIPEPPNYVVVKPAFGGTVPKLPQLTRDGASAAVESNSCRASSATAATTIALPRHTRRRLVRYAPQAHAAPDRVLDRRRMPRNCRPRTSCGSCRDPPQLRTNRTEVDFAPTRAATVRALVIGRSAPWRRRGSTAGRSFAPRAPSRQRAAARPIPHAARR